MGLKNLNEWGPSLSFQPPPTSTISLDSSRTKLSVSLFHISAFANSLPSAWNTVSFCLSDTLQNSVQESPPYSILDGDRHFSIYALWESSPDCTLGLPRFAYFIIIVNAHSCLFNWMICSWHPAFRYLISVRWTNKSALDQSSECQGFNLQGVGYIKIMVFKWLGIAEHCHPHLSTLTTGYRPKNMPFLKKLLFFRVLLWWAFFITPSTWVYFLYYMRTL